MKFDQELFGRRIQEARMRRGITQEAFAEEIDISISYYQKLERGARSCSLDILVLIAAPTCNYGLSSDRQKGTGR